MSERYCNYYREHVDPNYLTYHDLEQGVMAWITESQLNLLDPSADRIARATIEQQHHWDVRIRHFMLNYAVLADGVFTIPCCNDVFPFSDLDVQMDSAMEEPLQQEQHMHTHRRGSVVLMRHLPLSMQANMRRMAESLYDMCNLLELQLEINSLGAASHIIAEHLQQLISTAPYSATHSAAIVLVDRVCRSSLLFYLLQDAH